MAPLDQESVWSQSWAPCPQGPVTVVGLLSPCSSMVSCGHWCLFSPEEEVGNSQRVSNLPRSRSQPLSDSLSARWTLQCVSCREAEVPKMGLTGEERCTDVSWCCLGRPSPCTCPALREGFTGPLRSLHLKQEMFQFYHLR